MTTPEPSEPSALSPNASMSTSTSNANGPVPERTNPPSPPTPESIYTQIATYPFHADKEFLAGLVSILGHPDQPATPEELHENSALVLQTRCFYLSWKLQVNPPIDPAKYLEWSQQQQQSIAGGVENNLVSAGSVSDEPTQPQPQPPSTPSEQNLAPTPAATSSTTTIPLLPPQSTRAQDHDPPYPTSFAAIVDLITRNLPIPGIETIAPTVLEPGTSKIDKTPRRKKPWEKDDVETENITAAAEGPSAADASTTSTTTNGGGGDGHATTTPSQQPAPSSSSAQFEGLVKILQPNAIPASGLLSEEE